mmetsp:Transcript_18331/g.27769  ORF Transcript_18331/g.27769 Transcript_18331/m.27769 type:complete len:87 (+) Transcript_18331:1308-1568(+)
MTASFSRIPLTGNSLVILTTQSPSPPPPQARCTFVIIVVVMIVGYCHSPSNTSTHCLPSLRSCRGEGWSVVYEYIEYMTTSSGGWE